MNHPVGIWSLCKVLVALISLSFVAQIGTGDSRTLGHLALQQVGDHFGHSPPPIAGLALLCSFTLTSPVKQHIDQGDYHTTVQYRISLSGFAPRSGATTVF